LREGKGYFRTTEFISAMIISCPGDIFNEISTRQFFNSM